MSLRLLFFLMGLVTTAMIVGVIVTKVGTDPTKRPLTVGEMRSIERVCDNRCASLMAEYAKDQPDAPELRRRVTACMDECRAHLSRGRLGAPPSEPAVPSPLPRPPEGSAH